MNEIKKLQIENDRIMSKLEDFTNYENRDEFFDLIGELVANEIAQEKLCGEENE